MLIPMSVRFSTSKILCPLNLVVPSQIPTGTPIRSAIKELLILSRAVTDKILHSSASAVKINCNTLWSALCKTIPPSVSNIFLKEKSPGWKSPKAILTQFVEYSKLHYTIICSKCKECGFVSKNVSAHFFSHYKASTHTCVCRYIPFCVISKAFSFCCDTHFFRP